MKTTKLFLYASGSLLIVFAMLAFAFKSDAHDKKQINNYKPTQQVIVADIFKQNEMPHELRSNQNSQQVINNLSLRDFKIAPAGDGKYALEFNLDKKATTYIRIVDNGGYDVYFETFKDGGAYSKQIDLSLLAAGTYFFQVTQRGNTFTKKLIFS
jgi:hypothetical protein